MKSSWCIVPYAFLSQEGPDIQEKLRKKYKKYFSFYFNEKLIPPNIIYDIANAETVAVVSTEGKISYLMVYFSRKTPTMMKQLDYMVLIYGKYIHEISCTNKKKCYGRYSSWNNLKTKIWPNKKIKSIKQNNSLQTR